MSRTRILFVVLIVGTLLLTAAVPAMAAPPATGGGSGCSQFYTVQPGDNLFRIGIRFGRSVWSLMQLNGLVNPNLIYSGQTLCVAPGAPVPFGFLYIVHPGDTLYSIGVRFGWSAWYLAQVNHLFNPNYIFAGQALLIPYH